MQEQILVVSPYTLVYSLHPSVGDLSGVINDKKVPVKLYKQWSDRQWRMGVSVGHCANQKNSV